MVLIVILLAALLFVIIFLSMFLAGEMTNSKASFIAWTVIHFVWFVVWATVIVFPYGTITPAMNIFFCVWIPAGMFIGVLPTAIVEMKRQHKS